uniref:Coenzyme F420 hydrogenase/dehydrogenase beta subunit C-terminal domain-containing protein n=1 Tax=Odontella aurita TaxID=265563 RepID=A0A6U6HP53_9STRA|mmetsp:Transcript_47859/g.144760  ORF Transcript_47859/g.144760 Transcript_47859/m.144760 type:complete len:247 (+) Transcript_47859:251-991(+)
MQLFPFFGKILSQEKAPSLLFIFNGQDFKVHVKMDDDYIKKPYFCLPGSVAESAIADSCLACFDYTNALADVVVGYMGAPLDASGKMEDTFQTLTVRNSRGKNMAQVAVDAGRLRFGEEAIGSGSHEKISTATVASDSIVQAMVGGEVKEKGLPRFIGEVMAVVMRNIGPKGIGFARYSIDYHILRNYLHILDEWDDDQTEKAMPRYARDIINRYLEQDESFAKLKDNILAKRTKGKEFGAADSQL